MSNLTFEYCSLYYLNQWLEHDKYYCETLSNGTHDEKLSALKDASGFYRIARNLPNEFDEKKGFARYQPLLEVIDSVHNEEFKENLIEQIHKVEKQISEKYGGRGVLSLTTKFLWLKMKQPILIYDSQARNALGSKNGDLSDYHKRWRNNFEKYKKYIEEACTHLPDLHLYAVDQMVGTKQYIEELSLEPWFHERVFDIYLWHMGSKVRKEW